MPTLRRHGSMIAGRVGRRRVRRLRWNTNRLKQEIILDSQRSNTPPRVRN
jgi:hypothetical protein